MLPLLLGVAVWLYVLREGVVNRWNFRRVQVGMPRERVEQLLGKSDREGRVEPAPDDDGFFRIVSGESFVAFEGRRSEGTPACYWRQEIGSSTNLYAVLYDQEGKVAETLELRERPDGFIDRLGNWIGQWQCAF